MAVAQSEIIKKASKTAQDCKQAIPLAINGTTRYGPTEAPDGYGTLQEITTNDKNSKTAFAREHNTAWYILSFNTEGDLELEVIPTDTTNDYDFLFYQYIDTNFCDALLQHKVNPIRGNLSNNNNGKKSGKTGLTPEAIQLYHPEGTGDAFSTAVKVRQGQKYMLVLDNVTPQGKGHSLVFRLVKKITLSGNTSGEDNKPIETDINLADLQGKTIATTRSNANGNYKFDAKLNEHENYSLTFINDSSFVSSRTINTADPKSINTLTDMKVILPKLKAGAKNPLGNINFVGGLPTLLPESYPSVEALYRLMAKNKKLVILIEGHVNNPRGGSQMGLPESFPGQFQELSENRAATIRDYLLKRGIAPERMSTKGMAAREMLYPYAKTEAEQKANRRVEIKVVSLNGE